jgi:SAM-dependent methyltransferase
MLDELLEGSPAIALDVGCGTGIVGRLLQARGCEVLGVEPDPRMARVARERGLAVEVDSFEDWRAQGRSFDLLACGQAWHWVDPERGASKAAEVLGRGAQVGLFWNFGEPPAQVRAALGPIYARLEPEVERHSVLLGNADTRLERTRAALEGSGCFSTPLQRSWRWTRRYTTEQWCEALLTHSDHQALPADRREALLDAVARAVEALGGAFEMTYQTHLLSARRSSTPVPPPPG